jgi:nitrite reductase/ring-hydroxylating ferredoxin subunit
MKERRVTEASFPCPAAGLPPRPDRRLALRLLAAGAAGALVLEVSLLAGCSGSAPPGPAVVTVPLADLPEGKRVVVQLGSTPVELRRTGETIVARSLLCTHQGCVVAWQEEIQQYKCPCQGAWFDINGQVVAGPTTKPLLEFPVTLVENAVRVTEQGQLP